MNFEVKALSFFREQVESRDAKSRKIIYGKIQLLKQNPYRHKKLHSQLYSKDYNDLEKYLSKIKDESIS